MRAWKNTHNSKNNQMITLKKAQQETIGFVIIIMIIMIIGTIFLGIWLRANKQSGIYTESKEVADFLGASLSQTTECYKDSESDLKYLGELIRYCDENQEITCPNEENACDYINKTYTLMLQRFKPAGILGYYKLQIYYKPYTENNTETSEDTSNRAILEIRYGNIADCSVKIAGNTPIDSGNGDYIVNLETCESKTEV